MDLPGNPPGSSAFYDIKEWIMAVQRVEGGLKETALNTRNRIGSLRLPGHFMRPTESDEPKSHPMENRYERKRGCAAEVIACSKTPAIIPRATQFLFQPLARSDGKDFDRSVQLKPCPDTH